jgi:hypothetical protein
MNTNTKFPSLQNPYSLQYNKYGVIPVPITIVNGNNKTVTQQQTSSTTSNTDELHNYYNDNSTDSIVYESKPELNNLLLNQPKANVFDLNKFIKKL